MDDNGGAIVVVVWNVGVNLDVEDVREIGCMW